MSTGTEGTAGTNRFAPPTAEVADVATGATELAGRGMRLVAVLIDGLIQGAIYWILTIVAFRALDPRSGNISVGLIVGQLVLGFGLFVLIQGYLLHTQGQTVGKKLLGGTDWSLYLLSNEPSPMSITHTGLFPDHWVNAYARKLLMACGVARPSPNSSYTSWIIATFDVIPWFASFQASKEFNVAVDDAPNTAGLAITMRSA